MNKEVFDFIKKYTLLLAAFFLAEFIFKSLINKFDLTTMERKNVFYLLANTPLLLTILLNSIMMILLHNDIKDKNVKTSYVLLATFLFRPLGVCAFLLYLIANNDKSTSSPTTWSTDEIDIIDNS